jgi:hypothetical protein
MKREDLERYLERGNTLGFTKHTDSTRFLGWILLSKKVWRVEADDQRGPFLVRVVELDREVHEGDDYEKNEDYRVNERIWFKDLDAVERFLNPLGLSLEEIKWASDIDAP